MESAMEPTRIVMMDLDPHTCPEDHSGKLTTLLHSCTSTHAIDMQTVTDFPPARSSLASDLIVLRPSVTEDLSAMVQIIRTRWSPAPIVGLFCAGLATPMAVWQALPGDLDDFLTCPFRDIDVFPRIQRLLREQTVTRSQAAQEMNAPLHIDGLVGESSPFLRVLHILPPVAHSDATVLISGETGTGKELIAQAIHYQSLRRGKPFIPLNCGALPDHLFENELFGHIQGAFTDASSSEQGLVAEAEGGTLFLDEVDALSASAQVKLLRFLQNREYRPLGCSRSKTADVRIIAATNVDLRQQVQNQRFREDLYYRLNIISLRLPPLRERPEDIPLLATHFLRRYENHDGRESRRLSANALHKLVAYPWPGNVRELETVIQRAAILASSPVLQSRDIDLSGSYQHAKSEPDSFRAAKARAIEQFERTYLSNLLSAHEGNVSRAAQHAGEARRSLQRLLKKYDLDRRTFQS
jgi:DNA-binding NtrC family response regulator